MCESDRPSVRPFVCLSVRVHVSSVQMFDRTCVPSSMYAFVCLHARVREGVCLSPSGHPSVRLSVRPSVCLSACMFVRPNVCSHMRAFINACATFIISNFLLLTSNFLLLTSNF